MSLFRGFWPILGLNCDKILKIGQKLAKKRFGQGFKTVAQSPEPQFVTLQGQNFEKVGAWVLLGFLLPKNLEPLVF